MCLFFPLSLVGRFVGKKSLTGCSLKKTSTSQLQGFLSFSKTFLDCWSNRQDLPSIHLFLPRSVTTEFYKLITDSPSNLFAANYFPCFNVRSETLGEFLFLQSVPRKFELSRQVRPYYLLLMKNFLYFTSLSLVGFFFPQYKQVTS